MQRYFLKNGSYFMNINELPSIFKRPGLIACLFVYLIDLFASRYSALNLLGYYRQNDVQLISANISLWSSL